MTTTTTTPSRGKRATAVSCLLFLAMLAVAGWWWPVANEQFKFALPIVLPFCAYLFGADVYAQTRLTPTASPHTR